MTAGRLLDAALHGTVVITAYNGRHFEYGAFDPDVCMTDIMDEAAVEEEEGQADSASSRYRRFVGSFLDYYRYVWVCVGVGGWFNSWSAHSCDHPCSCELTSRSCRTHRPWTHLRTVKKLPETWSNQPLVRAGRCVCVHPEHYVMPRSDCLRQRPPPSAGSGRVLHLVPQTLWLHPLTAAHWHGLKHFRSAMWRLQVGRCYTAACASNLSSCATTTSILYIQQGLLAALELRGRLVPDAGVLPPKHRPQVIDVLAAITATMAGDSHDGAGLDYERMETLGDSVLKFISSTYLYCRYPEFFEGQLSLSKHYLVSNHNLWFRGLTGLQLGDYIRAVPFAFTAIPLPGTGLPARSWTPQCTAVRGKVMGDVMEALLGGAYVRGGIWGALAVAVHLHLLPPRAYDLMRAYQHQPHVRVLHC